MQINQIFDPRDRWQRARRMELVRQAHKFGHKDITEAWPKDLIIPELKSRNVPPPSVPDRTIGSDPRESHTSPHSHEVGQAPEQKVESAPVEIISAEEVLRRDFAAQQKPPPTYHEMRAAIKERGITLNRRWNKQDIEAIYNGENPAQRNK
jgi:hypothetical protein